MFNRLEMNKIIAIILTFGALACNKEVNDSSIIYGYEYFPTEIGSYKTYDVVEIFHDAHHLVHNVEILINIDFVLQNTTQIDLLKWPFLNAVLHPSPIYVY